MPPNGDRYDELRAQGRHDAEHAARSHAPVDPLERVAWAQGWGQDDQLRQAVMDARQAGMTWRAIGEAVGMTEQTAEARFGRGYDRARAYRARKRGQ